jgi:hypothetical protein
VAVVEVGGGSLADNDGAQHEGGRVTHVEMIVGIRYVIRVSI